MNAKKERYVNYIVDELVKSSSVEIYEKPVGKWEENPKTKEISYLGETSTMHFKPSQSLIEK